MPPEFNFFQHWYPLSPVEDLDPKRPTPVTVLGLRLVIWKPSSSETYRAFLDQCPHRLAPLSEGRVDEKTGNLMCSYHGWQFDEQGTCTLLIMEYREIENGRHQFLSKLSNQHPI
jgi:phenylpropionate dioxygenase-like ring-hydroxylating dioxygenase large terminal subunit